MSAPIGTIPRGLLDLLALKQQGENPNQLGNQVDPTLDLRDFWFNQLELDTQALFGGLPQTAALASGNTGFEALSIGGVQVSVPGNEVWYCRACNLTLNSTTLAAATDTIRAGVGITVPNANFAAMIGPATQDNVTGRANRFWTTEPMVTPVWLAPTTRFWAFVFDLGLAAGTQTLNLGLKATRLRI